jgi:hypothetical protein
MEPSELRARREAQDKAEAEGRVADSAEYRLALMARVRAGEITLEEAQSELAKVKRNAKRNGQVTRNQVFRGR